MSGPLGPHRSSFIVHRLVVARDRLDRRDDLLVGDLLGGAEEAGVAAVHQDGLVALRVAAQGVDQLPPLGVVEGTEVHGSTPSRNKGTSNSGRAVGERATQSRAASSASSR